MKKMYSSFAIAGLLSGGLLVYGQSGGGAAGGAGGGGSGAAGAVGASGLGAAAGAGGAVQAGQTVRGGAAARVAPGTAQAGVGANRGGIASGGRGGIGNQQGAIAEGGQPALPGTTPGINPAAVDNTGSFLDNQLTTPSTAVPFNALPGPVQRTLQTQSPAGNFGPISQQMTPTGPVYTVSVVRNGTPVEMQIAANGMVLPARTANNPGLTRAPSTPGIGATASPRLADPTSTPNVGGLTGAEIGANAQTGTGTALGNLQAGLPVSALPPQVQNSIRSQLGNARIQTISQDQFANGRVYRVTALRNGVPTEFQFAASGVLLGSNPVAPGTATSAFAPGVVGTLPGTQVVLGDLPVNTQNAIRDQLGTNQISRITQQQTPDGSVYWVTYDQNGRPMRMMVAANGTVRTNLNRVAETSSGHRNSVTLAELPDPVNQTLDMEAPDAEIVSIRREQRPAGDVFRVALRDEDGYVELVLDSDGNIVRDSREIPVVAIGEETESESEQPTGQRFSRIPMAVQNAVQAYAAESEIRSIQLALHENQTVFDVVYYRDGRRDRMLVEKDGTIVRIEEDVAPAVAVLESASEPPKLAIGDLPPAVRDTIRRQTDNLTIDELTTTTVGDQTVYQVSYRTNNAPVQLLVGTDGAIVRPAGRIAAEGASTALPAPVPVQEEAAVRTVDVSGSEPAGQPADEQAALGVAATSETGTEVSPPSVRAEPEASVSLADVPIEVQTTAKKLAGNSAIIKSIAPKLREGEMVYEVTFSQNNRDNIVIVSKDGNVRRDEPEAE